MSIVLSSYLSREQEHMIRLICRTDRRLPLFIVEGQFPAFPAGREGVGRRAQRASGGNGGEEQLSQAVYLPGVGELLYCPSPPLSPLLLSLPCLSHPLILIPLISPSYSHHDGQSRCALRLPSTRSS